MQKAQRILGHPRLDYHVPVIGDIRIEEETLRMHGRRIPLMIAQVAMIVRVAMVEVPVIPDRDFREVITVLREIDIAAHHDATEVKVIAVPVADDLDITRIPIHRLRDRLNAAAGAHPEK